MMKIKLLLTSLVISCLFFVASSVLAGSVAAAPRLFFDPSSANVAKGTDLPINLQINVESQSAFGADATITFPANDFAIKSVTNGGFFSDFSYALSDGKLEIHGFFSALYGSKSGSGTLAVITLNSNKDSGSGNLAFTCSAGSTDTEIIDSNGQNILACSSLNQEHLTYIASPNDNGPTNACQGTCGSNYNCNNGLFCFNGFCRNPDCREDNTCGCRQTATPKPTAKATVKPTIKPTPAVITLSKYTTPSPLPIASVVPQDNTFDQNFDYVRVGIWIALFVLAFLLLLGILRLFKKDNNPPQITPPTSTEPDYQPMQPVESQPESVQTEPVSQPVEPENVPIPTANSNPPQTPTI